jgi:hypothetical protein
VPNPYYTTVNRALKLQGCIIQLRRGGGAALSKWALIKEPKPEDFRDAAERKHASRSKVGQLEQQVRDLRRLIIDLRERHEHFLNNLQDRLERLEPELVAPELVVDQVKEESK